MYVYMSITVFWQLTTNSFMLGIISDCKKKYSFMVYHSCMYMTL